MKEATGELSTTVITIVAIAAVMAIFTAFLLPTLRAQIALSQACTAGPDTHIVNDNGSKVDCTADDGQAIGSRTWTCTYTPDKGSPQQKTCKD